MALVLVTSLAACAGVDTSGGAYLYQSGDDYVRLEPIEPGAPANSHPFMISASQLRELLAPLKVSHADAIGKASVFLNEELDTIVPPLALALSKAGPNQDVTFAVSGERGLLGKYSPKSLSTGRLFVSSNTINLIFGVMQYRLGSENLGVAGVAPTIVPGSRARRVDETVWKIDPVGGYFHERREDWVVFDRAALETTIKPGARSTPEADVKSSGSTAPAPAANIKAQEIENRLQVLDALRKRGAITEQEYLERRRGILEQL